MAGRGSHLGARLKGSQTHLLPLMQGTKHPTLLLGSCGRWEEQAPCEQRVTGAPGRCGREEEEQKGQVRVRWGKGWEEVRGKPAHQSCCQGQDLVLAPRDPWTAAPPALLG